MTSKRKPKPAITTTTTANPGQGKAKKKKRYTFKYCNCCECGEKLRTAYNQSGKKVFSEVQQWINYRPFCGDCVAAGDIGIAWQDEALESEEDLIRRLANQQQSCYSRGTVMRKEDGKSR